MGTPSGVGEPRSIFSVDTTDSEEQMYFKLIDKAIEHPEDNVISNGKPAHAVYLLNKFFETAKHSIKIYTGNLARTFDGVMAYADPQMAKSAVKFLSQEGSLNYQSLS